MCAGVINPVYPCICYISPAAQPFFGTGGAGAAARPLLGSAQLLCRHDAAPYTDRIGWPAVEPGRTRAAATK